MNWIILVMPFLTPLPIELIPIKEAARRALGPLIPAHSGTKPFASDPGLTTSAGDRTNAGRSLPAPYLVYFLLIDLLEFKHWGPWEKVAWSVLIDFEGRLLEVSHKKFGIGIFAPPSPESEAAAQAACIRIQKAVKAAQRYFDWRAAEAVAASRLNVTNNAGPLLDSLNYFIKLYRAKSSEAEARKDETIVTEGKSGSSTWSRTIWPHFELQRESRWLAIAAIEAFYSWTEHVFIHIAIIQGKLTSGEQIASRAGADWPDKFKGAVEIGSVEAKRHFDELLILRRELRNFVAHGAFGKDGQAFHFHSTAGAVPVLLPHRTANRSFTIGSNLHFDHQSAIVKIEEFIQYIWSEARAPARIYIQEYRLPSVMTFVADGSYAKAMQSIIAMESFCDLLSAQIDRASNMDW